MACLDGAAGQEGGRAAGHGARHGGAGAPRPDQLHGALRGPGTRPGASEAGGGASPTARSAAFPARTDRGPVPVPVPFGADGAAPCPQHGAASPCCDYRLSKVSPEPGPQGVTVEQVPLSSLLPARHRLGPTARAGGCAPPGTPGAAGNGSRRGPRLCALPPLPECAGSSLRDLFLRVPQPGPALTSSPPVLQHGA